MRAFSLMDIWHMNWWRVKFGGNQFFRQSQFLLVHHHVPFDLMAIAWGLYNLPYLIALIYFFIRSCLFFFLWGLRFVFVVTCFSSFVACSVTKWWDDVPKRYLFWSEIIKSNLGHPQIRLPKTDRFLGFSNFDKIETWKWVRSWFLLNFNFNIS